MFLAKQCDVWRFGPEKNQKKEPKLCKLQVAQSTKATTKSKHLNHGYRPGNAEVAVGENS